VSLPPFMSVRGEDLEIRVKAVPGASRDAIAGALGDRLKVRVAQPPEGGRANDAIRTLIANAAGLPLRSVTITQGHSNPQKSIQLLGAGKDAARVARALL